MSDKPVIVEQNGSVTIIRLNRPDKRNALNRALVSSLTHAFEDAAKDASRSVILTGNGPAFCAGMDLAELSATLDTPEEAASVRKDSAALSKLFGTIAKLPKPTIAAVNGAAVAGGAGLVTVCDFAIAETQAKFGYPEVLRGLQAAMVMPYLMRHVSGRFARDLLMTGRIISAEEAMKHELVNGVVPTGDCLKKSEELAALLVLNSPAAVAATKRMLRDAVENMPDSMQLAHLSADIRLTPEAKEGLRSFLENRKPKWQVNE